MRRVDSYGINEFRADTVHRLSQAVLQLVGHHTRRHGDTREVLHGVRLDGQALGAVLASRSAQHQVECIFRVQSQTRDLGAQLILGDCACLVAIAVQAEAAELRRREIDRVPFEHNARLSCIAAAKHGRRGRFRAEAVVDVGLKGRELLVGDCLGVEVARNVDVDDAAGVDVGRQQDRRKLNLTEVSKASRELILFCGVVVMRSGSEREAQDWVDGKTMVETHKALVFGQKHGNAGVDLTDSQRYKHR